MDQDSLSEAHAEIETMSEQIGMMNQEMLALEARTRALEAALEAIRRRILRDVPEDVKAEIASGRTINDVYMIAKAALTESTPPAGGQG